jgi:uncharacterized membrane protein
VSQFLDSFEKLKNVDFNDTPGLDELKNFPIDKQSLAELREIGGFASSIIGGAVGGALSGALTAFGAYSGVMAFGAASTGTAIATLSGAAATNATLAFLGGGSIAAGGLGMGVGMAVLGGLVAGPALAITGFIMGAKASANLDKAKSNYSEATKIKQEMVAAGELCEGIRKRSNLLERLLIRLDTLFLPTVYNLEEIISTSGEDYSQYSMENKQSVAVSASLVKAIKTLIDTSILTEDGKLTEESADIAASIQHQVYEQEKLSA